MNTSRLAHMYDLLTAKERLPLILAAEKRGDEIEQQRLESSAPWGELHCRDYLFRAQMVHVLTLIYVTEQLDHLANYWHSNWRLKATPDERPEHWLTIRETSAYLFCCNAEAWRRFCQEQNFNHEQLIAQNYFGRILDYCTEHMPNNAPSREELEGTLQALGEAGPVHATADTLLEKWRHAMREFDATDAIADALRARMRERDAKDPDRKRR
jgi:hypothetical protein